MRHFGRKILILLFIPLFSVQAACTDKGYTVVFVNGIFNTRVQADESRLGLQDKLGPSYNGQPLFVKLGYNPSHIAGLGDLTQAAIQGFAGTISNFDRDTILMQIHPEITTRKIFFVGHSQGTFYTNDIYDYLLNHGEPKASVGVYNVATPANYVAGGGRYFTSTTDTIVNLYREYAQRAGALMPLPANGDLDYGGAVGNGHNFINNYLAYGSERIVRDIQSGLARLETGEGTTEGGCFTPPENNLSYKAKEVLFAFVDPAATGIKVAAITGAKSAAYAYDGIKSGLAAVGSLFASATDSVIPKPRTENLPGSFDVVRSLYGAGATEEDLNDLLGKKQSGAVALALPPSIKEKKGGEVKGVSTETPPPLIPPTNLLPGGSPGFGGGGSAAANIIEEVTSPDAAEPQKTILPPSTIVPDGIPPTLVEVKANGAVVTQNYPSIIFAPVATSGTQWTVRLLFDEEISVTPLVVAKLPGGVSPDYPPLTQSVDYCDDSDKKTFCFVYIPPQGIDSRRDTNTPQEWSFEISDAKDVSGEIMAPVTYVFSIDTDAAAVTHTNGPLVRNSMLPVVDGLISRDNETVHVLINGNYFTTQATANYWFVTLQPGQELSEGYYDVEASSTDRFGNLGPSAQWQVFIDLTPPIITITPDITTADIDVGTIPTVSFSASDNSGGATVSCTFDHFTANICNGLDLQGFEPGPHTLSVTATDAAGNQATEVRNFNVLP